MIQSVPNSKGKPLTIPHKMCALVIHFPWKATSCNGTSRKIKRYFWQSSNFSNVECGVSVFRRVEQWKKKKLFTKKFLQRMLICVWLLQFFPKGSAEAQALTMVTSMQMRPILQLKMFFLSLHQTKVLMKMWTAHGVTGTGELETDCVEHFERGKICPGWKVGIRLSSAQVVVVFPPVNNLCNLQWFATLERNQMTAGWVSSACLLFFCVTKVLHKHFWTK